MIKIDGMTDNQIVRSIPDLIEPFITNRIRKEKHSFFVYRCSDYNSFSHLLQCHNFLFHLKEKELIEKFWSAIDLIYLKIDLPDFSPTKEYFDALRDMSEKEKIVKDFQLYEVKLSYSAKKPIMSVRTYKLIRKLMETGRKLEIIRVHIKGRLHISVERHDFLEKDFKIETHYGRKGYHVRYRKP